MTDSAGPCQPSAVQRIDGRLHGVHHVRDEQGYIVTTVTGPLKVEFRLEDFAQLLAGACVLALPVALTQEVRDLGKSLSAVRTLAVIALALVTLLLFFSTRRP